eukprot:5580472-Alexandrium_andersonii.AAC.1
MFGSSSLEGSRPWRGPFGLCQGLDRSLVQLGVGACHLESALPDLTQPRSLCAMRGAPRAWPCGW